MIRHTILMAAALATATIGFAGTAQSAGDIEIGGRTSLTAAISVVSTDPDEGEDTTTLLVSGIGAYTTQSGRFEVGAGLTIVGFFLDNNDLAIYSPQIQGRVNSNLLGPEENVLLYVGGVAGASFLRSDFGDDEFGIFGPKAGAEFYITPNAAIQLEDTFVVDTEGGTTNQFTIGFKLLFN